MRNEVQAFIAKDDLTGEDPEVRRIAVKRFGQPCRNSCSDGSDDWSSLFRGESGVGTCDEDSNHVQRLSSSLVLLVCPRT